MVRLDKSNLVKVSVLTFVRNVINDEGGTPGFDVLAFLTITFSDMESCALYSALNVSFTEVVSCKFVEYT